MTDRASDPYRLQRFVDAQNRSGTYETAVGELRFGHKRSHWMWFVFPQLAGLGQSAMARTYAIGSLDEARAYLAHPLLGMRLHECSSILTGLAGDDPETVFGSIDAVKLRSSMTLFTIADGDEPLFREVLGKYFGGVADEATRSLLGL